jgi:hypothetical protein
MKMKTIKLLLLFILLAPALLYAQTGPKFEVEGDQPINTGAHLRNKEVHYDIKFKNAGDEELKIVSVSATCGCSSALSTSDTLQPGEEGIIKFTFNGIGMGTITKSVVVNTNEKENNSHTISLTMNMVDPVTLNPTTIITQGKVGDEIKQTATMTDGLDKPIVINEVVSNSPAVKVSSDKMEIASGETAKLDISIKLYEDSPVNAAVFIRTSEGEFQIPILVDILSK